MTIDAAARLRSQHSNDFALMLGALCHDFGKPEVTATANGTLHAYGHDTRGALKARHFLEKLRAPRQLVSQVEALVQHHLAPSQFIKNQAGAKAYRRLARKLASAGVDMTLLYQISLADNLGRSTKEALAGQFPAGKAFLAKAKELTVDRHGLRDIVRGRDLIARGITPGPQFRELLDKCRELQDEHGWDDPVRVLDEVLKNH